MPPTLNGQVCLNSAFSSWERMETASVQRLWIRQNKRKGHWKRLWEPQSTGSRAGTVQFRCLSPLWVRRPRELGCGSSLAQAERAREPTEGFLQDRLEWEPGQEVPVPLWAGLQPLPEPGDSWRGERRQDLATWAVSHSSRFCSPRDNPRTVWHMAKLLSKGLQSLSLSGHLPNSKGPHQFMQHTGLTHPHPACSPNDGGCTGVVLVGPGVSCSFPLQQSDLAGPRSWEYPPGTGCHSHTAQQNQGCDSQGEPLPLGQR